MNECQEPGCKEKATMSWNGRKVCSDHYDAFREQMESYTRNQE